LPSNCRVPLLRVSGCGLDLGHIHLRLGGRGRFSTMGTHTERSFCGVGAGRDRREFSPPSGRRRVAALPPPPDNPAAYGARNSNWKFRVPWTTRARCAEPQQAARLDGTRRRHRAGGTIPALHQPPDRRLSASKRRCFHFRETGNALEARQRVLGCTPYGPKA